MKERPILFCGDMVNAILDGRKTQTRRVGRKQYGTFQITNDGIRKIGIECPYGQPGNRLWVREAFCFITDPFAVSIGVRYAADGEERGFGSDNPSLIPNGRTVYNSCGDDYPRNVRFLPSIHMPRWASRITLEITGVRLERVQDISADDVEAEGIDVVSKLPALPPPGADLDKLTTTIARHLFHELWDSINANRGYGWDINPWVWVIEFARVEEAKEKP